MLEVKVNFKNKYSDLKCPICKESNDSQEHIFECEQILKKCNIVVDKHILYSHIFEKDVETQVAALRLFQSLWSARQIFLAENEEPQVIQCDLLIR